MVKIIFFIKKNYLIRKYIFLGLDLIVYLGYNLKSKKFCMKNLRALRDVGGHSGTFRDVEERSGTLRGAQGRCGTFRDV